MSPVSSLSRTKHERCPGQGQTRCSSGLLTTLRCLAPGARTLIRRFPQMRRSLVLTLVLLVSAWAMAQQDMQRPSAPGGQNQTQTQQPGSAPGQASPGSPSTMAPMGGADMIEGCLGGSNPNYTVTDKAG